ncbi:bis(5'-nucleosyl)-tetraphosphatase [Novipirellula artificiosorum]|nr:NUDIX domain-containing protein [Novipirellula artificiosorum]
MHIEPDRTVQAAGLLLFLREPQTEFLLMRHARRWDLPKGHCEPGESYRETALRETAEETGIEAAAISLDSDFAFEICYPVTYKRTGDEVFMKTVKYFLGYLQDKPKLKLTEHESSKWFRWDPPHRIQDKTIDPLLAAVAKYLKTQSKIDSTRSGRIC